MPVGSTATPIRQRSSSISSRRSTTRKNPSMLRTRGSYETLDTGDLNTDVADSPDAAASIAAIRTACCGPTARSPPSRRSPRRPSIAAIVFPPSCHGNVFVVEPAGQSRQPHHRDRRRHDAAREEGLRERRVHRVDRRALPAGQPLVSARRHALHRGHVPRHHPAQGLHHRVPARSDPVAQARTAAGPRPHLSRSCTRRRKRDRQACAVEDDAATRLVDLLAHPNGWWRDTAQRMLVERGDKSVARLLAERAERAPDWRTRLHALWTLDGIDALEPETVVRRRWTTHRATCGRPTCGCRSAGRRGRTARSRRRC